MQETGRCSFKTTFLGHPLQNKKLGELSRKILFWIKYAAARPAKSFNSNENFYRGGRAPDGKRAAGQTNGQTLP